MHQGLNMFGYLKYKKNCRIYERKQVCHKNLFLKTIYVFWYPPNFVTFLFSFEISVQVEIETPATLDGIYPVDSYELLQMEMVATNLNSITVKVIDSNSDITSQSVGPIYLYTFNDMEFYQEYLVIMIEMNVTYQYSIHVEEYYFSQMLR